MTELTDLSETDASNTAITSINIDEGCAPSGINNAIRNTLGLIRRAFKTSIFRLRDSTDQTKLLGLDLSGLTTATTLTIKVPNGQPSYGQCYLRLNGANLQLIRYGGNLLTIDGVGHPVPSGGVSLAPTSLSASTVYYIYAYMSGSTMTLEASTTASELNATYGIQTKVGDGTRSLVGYARTSAATAWADDGTSAHVISYYNPKPKRLLSVQTINRAFTGTSMAKISSDFDVFFLAHPDRPVRMDFVGALFNDAANIRTSVACAVGTTTYDGGILLQPADTGGHACPAHATITGLAVATNHTGTMYGAASSGTATLQYNTTAPGFRCSLTVEVWG